MFCCSLRTDDKLVLRGTKVWGEWAMASDGLGVLIAGARAHDISTKVELREACVVAYAR